MKRQFRLEQLKAIEREYKVARLATESLKRALEEEPSLLFGENLKPADARIFEANLEATYLLRLFAEFEQGLRDWWRNGLGRSKKTQTYDLIQGVAAKRAIPSDDRDNVHAVREYRNALIHEDDTEADPILLGSARSYLCKYLSRLPVDW